MKGRQNIFMLNPRRESRIMRTTLLLSKSEFRNFGLRGGTGWVFQLPTHALPRSFP